MQTFDSYAKLNKFVAGTGIQFYETDRGFYPDRGFPVLVTNEYGNHISVEGSITKAIRKYIPNGCGGKTLSELFVLAEEKPDTEYYMVQLPDHHGELKFKALDCLHAIQFAADTFAFTPWKLFSCFPENPDITIEQIASGDGKLARSRSKKGEYFARLTSEFVNNMSCDEEIEPFIKCMANDHNTLQQTFTSLCLKWLVYMANTDRVDGRNEFAQKIARKAVAGIDQKYDVEMPFI